MLLIDSDVVVDWLDGDESTVHLIRELRKNRIAISVVSHIELREGIVNARDRPAAERVYRGFLRNTRMLVVSRPVGERAGDIRADLRRRGLPVEPRSLDILIAATAVEHGMRLVTRNVRHYMDIPAIDLYPT